MNDLAKELWAGERIRCMVIGKQNFIDLMIAPARESNTAPSIRTRKKEIKLSILLVKKDECTMY